jgi:hypothetical protein
MPNRRFSKLGREVIFLQDGLRQTLANQGCQSQACWQGVIVSQLSEPAD